MKGEGIKEKDLAITAYIIWQERKRFGDPDADNANDNWFRAEQRLKTIKQIEAKYNRGMFQ